MKIVVCKNEIAIIDNRPQIFEENYEEAQTYLFNNLVITQN
jgi:hypothetical protein